MALGLACGYREVKVGSTHRCVTRRANIAEDLSALNGLTLVNSVGVAVEMCVVKREGARCIGLKQTNTSQASTRQLHYYPVVDGENRRPTEGDDVDGMVLPTAGAGLVEAISPSMPPMLSGDRDQQTRCLVARVDFPLKLVRASSRSAVSFGGGGRRLRIGFLATYGTLFLVGSDRSRWSVRSRGSGWGTRAGRSWGTPRDTRPRATVG